MEKPLEQCFSLLHQISLHPLFSILITFFLLNLLYTPNLLYFIFSPVLITSSLILTTLVHFGTQKAESTPKDHIDPIQIQPEIQYDTPLIEFEQKTSMIFCNSLVEWGQRGGPLEVIYEEYEGEEDESDSPEYSNMVTSGTKRLDNFSYYSNTDSDTDSDESLKDICFMWEDEDEEGMIEIALEEDNLIEIDLQACRFTCN